ncbi:MAG: serine hydrolase domain-containing protein [Capnocytophaga sp.]|nr:serine hydrolase domain-containing protein [Capnocytophaga sp.]
MSFFTFFQNIFGQKPLTKEKIFATKIESITSMEMAIEKAEEVVQYLLSQNLTPSVAVSFSKQGHTIWEAGYGYADIENEIKPDPKQTLYRVASVSKTITGAALTKMQEQGWIDWDCSVYDYVPSFPKKTYDITIKQLAGHLAGIRGYKGREVFNNEYLSIEQGIDFFANDPLLFEPGTKYFYNSYDFNLISLAMQNACKMPFEAYVNENIFAPLQMENSVPDMGFLLPNEAIPYSGSGKKAFHRATDVNNFYKLAGGGFLSSANDINRFGNAILGETILSPDYQKMMLESQKLKNGNNTGYGIGWQVAKDWNNRLYYGHIGNGIGGFAWFYLYPEEEVVVTMLFNITNPSIGSYIHRIVDYILQGANFITFDAPNYPSLKENQDEATEIEFEENEILQDSLKIENK